MEPQRNSLLHEGGWVSKAFFSFGALVLLGLNLWGSYVDVAGQYYLDAILSMSSGGCLLMLLADVIGYIPNREYLNAVVDKIWTINLLLTNLFILFVYLPSSWQWQYGMRLGCQGVVNILSILFLDVFRNTNYYDQKMWRWIGNNTVNTSSEDQTNGNNSCKV